jgi:hypothetical protein
MSASCFAGQVRCNKIGDYKYCNDDNGNSSTTNQVGNYKYTNYSNGDMATTHRFGNTTTTDYYNNSVTTPRPATNNAQSLNNSIAHGLTPLDTTPLAGLASLINRQRDHERDILELQRQRTAANERAEQAAKQQKLQEDENKRRQEVHDLDMKLKRAQLAKIEADDPSIYPSVDNYDNEERFLNALVKHGVYVGKKNAAIGKVSKTDLLTDKTLSMPDIETYSDLQVYFDAVVRYGEASGHQEYFAENRGKRGR